MNSKQRRTEKRKGLEKKVGGSKHSKSGPPSHSVEEMNDFCPFMYEKCGHPRQEYNFDCFGKYKMCQYYQKLSQ